MQSMNFDQRTQAVKEWMKAEILPRFNPPNNLNPSLILNDIVGSVNKHLPSKITTEEMPAILSHVQDKLIQIAPSRTLPPVRTFIEATRNIPQSHREEAQRGEVGSKVSTYLRLAVDRIRSLKPVSDHYITGAGRADLYEHGITDDHLAPYEEAIRRTQEEVYRGAEPMRRAEAPAEQGLAKHINRMPT